MAQLKCKHVFHEGCLSSWQERSARCPLCRKNMLWVQSKSKFADIFTFN